MCGRMTLTRSGAEIADYWDEFRDAFTARFAAARVLARPPAALDGGPLRPRYNLCPSQDVLTLVPRSVDAEDPEQDAAAACRAAWKRWGLVPSWARDPAIGHRLFNARSETVAEKPSFRAAFRRRRCLVLADGFYEWTPKNRDHRPFHFRPADAPLLAFAGLYEHWRGEGGEVIDSCTVLTTEAGPDLRGVHHRMPVILNPPDAACWLDPEAKAAVLASLTTPAPEGTLERRAVSRYVNDPRHDDEGCLASEAEAEEHGKTPAAPSAADAQGSLFGDDPAAGDDGGAR